MRLAPTRLVPFSYFCTCWKVRPSASPSFSWLMPSMMRRMRTRLPTYLSTGLGALVDISGTSEEQRIDGVYSRRADQNANSYVDLSTGGFPLAGISADIGYQTVNIHSSRSPSGNAPSNDENQGGDDDDRGRNVAGACVKRWRNCRR